MIVTLDEIGLDSFPANCPPTVRSVLAGAPGATPEAVAGLAGGRVGLDIEQAVQWAVAQSGYLPWRGVADRELMLDGGYTAIPKGVDRQFYGRGTVLRGVVDPDAAAILAALALLDPWTRSVLTANAKARRRPDWMEGIEPNYVAIRRRSRKKHRRVVVGYRWEPCGPDTIRASREIYARWHAGMGRLAERLSGAGLGFRINGFAAPAAPWDAAPAERA